jgi:AGZA family xanthine/uracil permease-like MFS transporter
MILQKRVFTYHEINQNRKLNDPIDNIAYGIIAAIILWILFHNVPYYLGKLSPNLLPPGWDDLKEPYDIGAMLRMQETHGRSRAFALLPPWLRKALSGNKRFWAYTDSEIQRQLEGREMSRNADAAAAELRQAERDEMRKVLGHMRADEVPIAPFDVERPAAVTPASVSGSYEETKDLADVQGKANKRNNGLISPQQFSNLEK